MWVDNSNRDDRIVRLEFQARGLKRALELVSCLETALPEGYRVSVSRIAERYKDGHYRGRRLDVIIAVRQTDSREPWYDGFWWREQFEQLEFAALSPRARSASA